MQIEFFFDCSSPWTYLAFEQIQRIVPQFDAQIIWRPILVGGIFNAVNPGVEFFKKKDQLPPRKIDYIMKDMAEWAHHIGVTIHFPPAGHPVNSVKVMRGCLLLEPEGKLIPFARAAFQAYFGEQRLISDDSVIADLCRQVDVDPAWLLARVAEQDVKDALRANVDEAISRGAFGSPTMYLDRDDMYFGVDRIQLLSAAMERKSGMGA
jgi:2-hydroxychromene-2-carboxylate isomerase